MNYSAMTAHRLECALTDAAHVNETVAYVGRVDCAHCISFVMALGATQDDAAYEAGCRAVSLDWGTDDEGAPICPQCLEKS